MGDTDELPVKPYSLKTLMPGWQYFSLAYPKDYDAYDPVKFPRRKNLFLSSYNRLGVDDAPWVSEKTASRLNLEEARQSQSQKRPLINILTYHTTEGEQRERYAGQIGVTEISDEDEKMDFSTSTHEDFKSPLPFTPRVYGEDSYKPETKFRRLITEFLNIRRPGLGKYYDENMEYLEAKRKPISPPPFKINLV